MKFFTNVAYLFNLSSFSIQFHALKPCKKPCIHPNSSIIIFLLDKFLSILGIKNSDTKEAYCVNSKVTSDTMFNGESRARETLGRKKKKKKEKKRRRWRFYFERSTHVTHSSNPPPRHRISGLLSSAFAARGNITL